jgi:hypothetical protein
MKLPDDDRLQPKHAGASKWNKGAVLSVHFQTVEEIQCAVTRELNSISKTAFLEGIKKLKKRANKCIDQGGIYFEE